MKVTILKHLARLIGKIYNEIVAHVGRYIVEHGAQYFVEMFLNMDTIQSLFSWLFNL